MGHFKAASPQIAKRNKLLSAYCAELDQIRSKYGYTCGEIGGHADQVWESGARVPRVSRHRMVKLQGLIDLLISGKKSTLLARFQNTPTLERYTWRCAFTPEGYVGVLKFRTRDSDKFQIRDIE